MEVNGESIYGSERCPFGGGMVGLTTAQDSTVYLHVLRRPGKEATIVGIKNKVLSAHLLATGEKAQVIQKGDRLFLRGLPRKAPDPYDSVIVMELNGKPKAC